MKKSELHNAILILAKHVGKENTFSFHIESIRTFDSIVRDLVYELFLMKFNVYNSPVYLFNAHSIIHQYATELNENDFVTFQSEE